jgi:hypothetical protein
MRLIDENQRSIFFCRLIKSRCPVPGVEELTRSPVKPVSLQQLQHLQEGFTQQKCSSFRRKYSISSIVFYKGTRERVFGTFNLVLLSWFIFWLYICVLNCLIWLKAEKLYFCLLAKPLNCKTMVRLTSSDCDVISPNRHPQALLKVNIDEQFLQHKWS